MIKKICDTICWIWKRKPSNNGNIYIIQSVDNHKGNENAREPEENIVDDNLYLWMLTEMWNINIVTMLFCVFFFPFFLIIKTSQEHGAKV